MYPLIYGFLSSERASECGKNENIFDGKFLNRFWRNHKIPISHIAWKWKLTVDKFVDKQQQQFNSREI